MENSNKGTIEFKTDADMKVDLSSFANSLNAIADEYANFLKSRTANGNITPHLVITGVRGNSIDIDLALVMPSIVPVVSDATTIIEFFKYIKYLIEFFTGNRDKDKSPPTVSSSKNIASIVNPVANHHATQINIVSPVINITINHAKANEIKDTAEKYISDASGESSYDLSQKAMCFYQARNSDSKGGDKSIIRDIADKPVKTSFISDSVKQSIIHPRDENIFDVQFIVDVTVIERKGEISEYFVRRLYKIVPIEKTNRINLPDNPLDEE